MIVNIAPMKIKKDPATDGKIRCKPVNLDAYAKKTFKSPSEGYRMAMYELLESIKEYAILRNYPNFGIIINGGTSIFLENKKDGWMSDQIKMFAGVIDAAVISSYFYGCNADWDDVDDEASPQVVRDDLNPEAAGAQKNGVSIWVQDYCSTPSKVKDSQKKCEKAGFQASFQAKDHDLCNTPSVAMAHQTKEPCYCAKDVKNFVSVLDPTAGDPPQFKDKNDYVSQLVNCDADALIVDIDYNGTTLTADDVSRLKYKSNGARRMVYCNCSLGEAETGRPYWNEKWSTTVPDWAGSQNDNENFYIKYWTAPWKKILIGSKRSYIDNILYLGFDGIFANETDAFTNFE